MNEQVATAKWEEAKLWKPGTVVYCCASSTFRGGAIQHGDYAVVCQVQPRKKMVWLVVGTESLMFSPALLAKYLLSTEPPPGFARLEDRKAERWEVGDEV